MRLTALDKSFPLSYNITSNDASIPIFSHSLGNTILNASSNLATFVNPLVEIGGHPFADLSNDSYLRLNANTNTQSLAPISGVSFGYQMELPPDDEKYAYNVSGSIRPAGGDQLPVSIFPSLVIGHLDTTHYDHHLSPGSDHERYIITVINEIPLITLDTRATDGYHNALLSFNFSFHDNGTPPNESSALFFCIAFRNTFLNSAIVPATIFNINVWRQLAPLKLYNQWQA